MGCWLVRAASSWASCAVVEASCCIAEVAAASASRSFLAMADLMTFVMRIVQYEGFFVDVGVGVVEEDMVKRKS